MLFDGMTHDEKVRIRNTDLYKALSLALTDNAKTLTAREATDEANLNTFIFSSSQTTIAQNNGSATILEQSLPTNTAGRIFAIGVKHYGGEDKLTFNILVNNQIIYGLSKIAFQESWSQPIDLKIPLPFNSTIKIVGYNSDAAAPHDVKVFIKGYYKFVSTEGVNA